MLTIWVLALTVLLVFLVVTSLPQLWGLYKKYRVIRHIPGLPVHWFWGNLEQMKLDRATIWKWVDYIQRDKHKMVKMWFGPFKPALVVTHCSLVKTTINLPKDMYAYSFIMPWLGGGLATADKRWFGSRRLITPAFHYEILRGYVPVINSCLKILIDKWTPLAKDDAPVYVVRDLSQMTLDILMQCAFSSKTNCQNLTTADHLYINVVNDIIRLIDERIDNPLHFINFIYYRSSKGREFHRACNLAHSHTRAVVKERKAALGLDGSTEERERILRQSKLGKNLDFLNILLLARDEEGNGLTDQEIRDEADTFMSAHHTTTNALSVILYCLAQHPEHQEKIREEVNGILMGREWLEYDDLKELEYTTWCIKEARRLYPPVSKAVRITAEDTDMDGHIIPKGTTVILDILQVHRHPDTWDNPSEYNPLRFHPQNTKGRHPFAYIPFSAGGHNCIGQNFAFKEERIVISSLISRFQVSLVDKDIEIVPRSMLHVERGMKLRLKPIFPE